MIKLDNQVIKLNTTNNKNLLDPSKNKQFELNNENSQQFVMRDDIITVHIDFIKIQFSDQLVSSARNKYRKKNYCNPVININRKSSDVMQDMSKHKGGKIVNTGSRNDRYTQSQRTNITQYTSAQQISMNHVSSEKFRVRCNDGSRISDLYYVQSSQGQREKIQPKKKQLFIMRHKKSSFDKGRSMTPQVYPINQTNKQHNESSQIQTNSYNKVEKKYNKKQLKPSGLQGWLNQALIEASPGQNIDKNIQNAAINKYGIGRSALLSNGINPANVQRLYKSFFVYSIGFNNLLKDLCNSNMVLRKSVWKVFAILLEYCSGGNFETMIGQIERDKTAKLAAMKEQIQKRQKIIENNQQIHEAKNAKIYKQLKEMQDRNKGLEEQKKMILQEFHESQQAFNQQILLRLQFESRINQIHGVYQEIQDKNDSLKEAHAKMIKDYAAKCEKIEELQNTITSLEISLESVNHDKNVLERQYNTLQQSQQRLTKNLHGVNSNYLEAKNNYENSRKIIEQQNRKIQQFQKHLQNSQISQQCILKSDKVKSAEYQRSLHENIQLQQTIKNQIKTINKLMEEARLFGAQRGQIKAMVNVAENKTKQIQEKYNILKCEKIQLQEIDRQRALQLQKQQQKCLTLQQNLTQCYQSIKSMKQKYNQLSTQYDQSLKTITNLEQYLESKKQQQKYNKNLLQQKDNQIANMITQLKGKQYQISILQQQIQSDLQINTAKINKFINQVNMLTNKCQKYQKQRDNLIQQIDRNRQLYESVFVKFKNQHFQRNNIELRFKQSLTVMEEENQHIKKLNIRISQLNEDVDQFKHQIKHEQFLRVEEVKKLTKDIQFWKQVAQKRLQEVSNKKMYVHPLTYQNICGRLLRMQQSNNKLQKQINNYKVDNASKQFSKLSGQQKIFELKNLLQKQYYEQQEKLKNNLMKKQQELKFLREKYDYKAKKFQQLEVECEKMKKEKQQILIQQRQKQTYCQAKIKERNIQIQELNKSVERLIVDNKNLINQQEILTKKVKDQENKHQLLKDNFKKQLQLRSNLSKEQKKQKGMKQKQQKQRAKNDKAKLKDKQQQNLNGSRKVIESYAKNQKKNQMQDQQKEDQYDNIQSVYEKTPSRLKIDSKIQNSQDINQEQQAYEPQQDFNANESESPKKKQDIRKKLKSAYLYYNS